MSSQKATLVSWNQVAAFRLSRHHLSERAPSSRVSLVAADMMGAQAQVLPAAQISIATRTKGSRIQDLDRAIWNDHSLVRAWCMRRTMFLLPSTDLAVFIRGTTRRPAYIFNWALRRIGSRQHLDNLLDRMLEAMHEPITRVELARTLSKSHGYKYESKKGGGWGSKRDVPWIKVGATSLPVGYLLHAIAAREAICSGPNKGAESTYVRVDKWIKDWKDLSQEKAERLLLTRYLKAFGPATLQDFALWMGLYVRDAREIWKQEAENMVEVDVEGWKASILESDLEELEKAELDQSAVRLLPYFDSFLLGHRSHRNIVDVKDHKKVYRNQGWVSPVLLVDGRALGVWSHVQNKKGLEVTVSPFSKLSRDVASRVEEEAAELGRYLGCPDVKTVIG